MKFKILIGVLILIIFIGTVSASIEDIGFNVSSELKPDVDGQFVDENVSRIRIIDGWDIDKYSDSGSKYNDTVYIFNETVKAGNFTTHIFSYGEFIIIDGKKYWVDVSAEDISNPNYEKCLEYLDYFNEHNNFEPVPVEIK